MQSNGNRKILTCKEQKLHNIPGCTMTKIILMVGTGNVHITYHEILGLITIRFRARREAERPVSKKTVTC